LIISDSYQVIKEAFDKAKTDEEFGRMLIILPKYFPDDLEIVCDALKGRYPQYAKLIDNFLFLK
jgi:hypothetical protein